jgi:hypothetical protein
MSDRPRSPIPSALCLIGISGAVACLTWVAMSTVSGVGSPADVTPPKRLSEGAAPRMSGAVRHPKEADARSSSSPPESPRDAVNSEASRGSAEQAGRDTACTSTAHLPIPPEFQPTLDGLRDLVPIGAWEEALGEEWHGAFPVDDDLVRAHANQDVRSALYTALRTEIALGVLEQLGEDPVALAEAERIYGAARRALMLELARASGYGHFEELDELFQKAIEGE